MNKEFYQKARDKYWEIVNGRKGRWFDPGEYEDLIKDYFQEIVPTLLQGSEEEAKKFLEPPPGSPDDAVLLNDIHKALRVVRSQMGFDDDEEVRNAVILAMFCVFRLAKRLGVQIE